MQQRTPEENQLRCLQGLKLLFQHAPYDRNPNAGVVAMRGKMELFDEDLDNPAEFLQSIVKIAKMHTGFKVKDLKALGGEDKAREVKKAKDLINLVAEIDVSNPQHFVDASVRIGEGVYHIHQRQEASAVVKTKPRSASDEDHTEVSPRSQPPLKRQSSRDAKMFSVPDNVYNNTCYDLIREMKAAHKKGNYPEISRVDKFNCAMYEMINKLAVASRQGTSIITNRELIETAKNFLDEYYVTYVAAKQRKEPHEFRQAFSDLSKILGCRGKDVSMKDLEKVQDACEKVYHGFLRVNEQVTSAMVQARKDKLSK